MLLHVPAMIWASEKYETRDSVLMVLADERYDPTDYIRDWDEYLKLRGLA
jgi:glucan phosphoethanolaminetransferase (alkaline phosphatase superfamily)